MPKQSVVLKHEQRINVQTSLPEMKNVLGEDVDPIQSMTDLIKSKNNETWARAALKAKCNEAYLISKIQYTEDEWVGAFQNFKDEDQSNPLTWVLMSNRETGTKYAINMTHYYVSKQYTPPDEQDFGGGAKDVTPCLVENSNIKLWEMRDVIKDDIMDMDEVRAHLQRHGAPTGEEMDARPFQEYVMEDA